MATYQETNDLLNESLLTPEEAVEKHEQLLDHSRLKKAGALKKIAKKIRAKPPAGEV